MKWTGVVIFAVMLQACGTIGGAVSGAGDDLRTVGDYIKKAGK